MAPDGPVSRFVSAPDGLRLHVVEYRPVEPTRIPVVCLAGLSRNGRDFAPLAQRLVQVGHPVVAIDYRGRGLSGWDKDWRRYDMAVEREDILSVLVALGISRAAFVGTSRGGLHVMGLAAARPGVIAASVLNDIGPVVEPQGLMKIKVQMAGRQNPANWAQAVDMIRQMFGPRFPGLSARDWDGFAHAVIREEKDRLFWDYDPALARTLDAIGPDMKPTNLWPAFEALAQRPVLAIRGTNSDILAPETFAQMTTRVATCRGLVVPDQGHAPLLSDAQTLSAIAGFLADVV